MRARVTALVVLSVAVTTCATPPPPPPPPKIDYKEELRKHGEWLVVPPHGKLWHPHPAEVGEAFVPYFTGGYWLLGPRGWTFEGKWEWSDLVFRHGRWIWIQDYDWLWSLDEKEGLAFVQWRTGSEYVGWAPLPPPIRSGPPAPEKWVYVKARHFAQPDLEKFKLPPDEQVRAAEITEPLPATAWSGPPVPFLVEKGGLVQQPDGGLREPELQAPTAAPVVEQAAPQTAVEVETATPPPKKVKDKKKKKKK